jgi:hypothetical protein
MIHELDLLSCSIAILYQFGTPRCFLLICPKRLPVSAAPITVSTGTHISQSVYRLTQGLELHPSIFLGLFISILEPNLEGARTRLTFSFA